MDIVLGSSGNSRHNFLFNSRRYFKKPTRSLSYSVACYMTSPKRVGIPPASYNFSNNKAPIKESQSISPALHKQGEETAGIRHSAACSVPLVLCAELQGRINFTKLDTAMTFCQVSKSKVCPKIESPHFPAISGDGKGPGFLKKVCHYLWVTRQVHVQTRSGLVQNAQRS